MNEPIDLIHQMSIRAISDIRSWVTFRRADVAEWEPAPMPSNFTFERAARRA